MEDPLRHTTYQGTSVPTGKGRSNSSDKGKEQPPLTRIRATDLRAIFSGRDWGSMQVAPCVAPEYNVPLQPDDVSHR